MTRAAGLALLVLAVAAPSAGAATERHFQTPSHRIACLMTRDLVRCDTFFLNDVGFFLTRTGKGHRSHVTDTVALPGERVLAYGRSMRLGVFTCTSRPAGLTCENRRHHGFFVSVQRQQAY